MEIWHETEDAPRIPGSVRPGEVVEIWVGSFPIEPGQRVTVDIFVQHPSGGFERQICAAKWRYNDFSLGNGYWQVVAGPFTAGDQVEYAILGKSGPASVPSLQYSFVVQHKREGEQQCPKTPYAA